jgi:hypothetical protein
MSVLAISVSLTSYLPNTQKSSSGIGSVIKNLADALQSGDLKSAQDAYAQLQSALKGTQNSSTAATSPSTPTTQALTSTPMTTGTQANAKQALFTADFDALGKALQSGDLNAAQDAFKKLGQDMLSAGKTHRHHHHHHHGASSVNQDSASSTQTGTTASSGGTTDTTGITINILL